MSHVLGPIHHWIFEQICLAEARGHELARGLAELDPGAEQRWDEICAQHPGQFSGRPLEELVDGNIHGSLDGMIATVQAREAALAAWALREGGEKGGELLGRLYADDGRRWGAKSRKLLESVDARSVFGALREFWLEGMPCDVREQLVSESPRCVEWSRFGLPLSRYWRESGVDGETLFALHRQWLEAFVTACGDGLRLEVPAQSFEPDGEFRFRIVAEGKEES